MFNSRLLIVRFFCLLVLVVFANSVVAENNTIRSKNLKTFKKVSNAVDKGKYKKAIKLLKRVEKKTDLNSREKAYVYNYRGSIALSKGDYEASKSWFEKALALKDEDIGILLVFAIKKSLIHIKEILSTHQPNYQNSAHLLESLDTTETITGDHYRLAVAAYKMSKEHEARAILNKVETLGGKNTILPEKWLLLKASMTPKSSKKIKLLRQAANHYSSKSSKVQLARALKLNKKGKESDLIYAELYEQGELTSQSELLIAAYAYGKHLKKPLEATLIIAEGMYNKIIKKNKKYKQRLNAYFSYSQGDENISARQWLEAGDKFWQYQQASKAAFCFKKAYMEDEELRDDLEQRLKKFGLIKK